MSLLIRGSPSSGLLHLDHSIEGGVILTYSGWVYPHLADGVLIYQINTTDVVH